MSTGTDDSDDLDTTLEEDLSSTGAAADSVDLDDTLKGLPRLLRFAVLSYRHEESIRQRLVADIAALVPGLPLTAAWGEDGNGEHAIALAAELDRLAVTRDQPDLRSLADCVRLLSLPIPGADDRHEDHRRVGKALLLALRQLPSDIDIGLAAEIETIADGWAALPPAADFMARWSGQTAVAAAGDLGRRMARRRVQAAEAVLRKDFDEKTRARENAAAQADHEKEGSGDPADETAVPADHVIVCRMAESALKNPKAKDIVGPLKPAINTALPLAPVPPLHEVRNRLLFEFPYAEQVIDFALADLVGRRTVRLRPLLLVGEPGGGKSRFARRLGEVLGVAIWRTDASRSDGAVFGGTDKRWYSAEPCHPFLAVAQARQANPLVIIDELEKAGTRADYGRFWDCLLGFLEPETASRYPDPALQATLDLSQVSYVATANTLDPLPSPLRDRFRTVTFPKPAPEHLDALLPPVIADLAADRGLDRSWIKPLNGYERDAVATHWRGGSVRKLRRIVDVVLRAQEKTEVRN